MIGGEAIELMFSRCLSKKLPLKTFLVLALSCGLLLNVTSAKKSRTSGFLGSAVKTITGEVFKAYDMPNPFDVIDDAGFGSDGVRKGSFAAAAQSLADTTGYGKEAVRVLQKAGTAGSGHKKKGR